MTVFERFNEGRHWCICCEIPLSPAWQTLVQPAANGNFEPKVTDAAERANGSYNLFRFLPKQGFLAVLKLKGLTNTLFAGYHLSMKKVTRPPVDRLLRGIATDHVETVRDAWREILQGGAISVPQIQEKLASSAWTENPRGPLSQYLGVLLSILDELDASVFEKEIARLRMSKLHPMHMKTLDILSQRILEEPATHIAGGVPVFVASDIVDRSVVIRNIKGWSKTKGLSLDNVTRIDVIARQPELDYLGAYNLFFSGIILTWPINSARGIKLWWRRLGAEFTFYHEVGHHVSGHIEGGQVAEQEQEADEYARSMMLNSRPVFMSMGRMLLRPFKPLLKRTIASVGRRIRVKAIKQKSR